MEAGRYVDPADDYEAAAEFVASKYGRPIDAQLMRALVNVPAHVIDSIECDPQCWSERVNAYAYGQAMPATTDDVVMMHGWVHITDTP